ncbi:F-box protein SKIP14-like [Tripterygium wilfordii]|uniref:F-box protein SKIP14-like n=1 Tax=Tripterygium wilfordii TaxID=458696 RepID=A0A7J7D504_TRIWF|nr:F-box protein SKIP14-like [Tripterygium wilfordii]KAF5741136.1 F-box protein SKIP14-like [Tripterygium wilfordii]
MALNFSHRPIFPAHLSEDKLASSMRIANGYLVDGIQEKAEECFDYRRDGADRCGSHESVSSDILDLLPSDPFGMDMSTTFTAITGWLEDLEVDYGGGFRRNDVGTGDGDYQLYAGLNFIWSNAMKYSVFSANMGFDEKLNVDGRCSSRCLEEKQAEDALLSHGGVVSACNVDCILSLENETRVNKDGGFLDFQSKELGPSLGHDCVGSACNVDDILSMGNETRGNEDAGFVDFQSEEFDAILSHDDVVSACKMDGIWRLGNEIRSSENAGCVGFQTQKIGECSGVSLADDDGAPHPALHYAFAYLGVRDLLAVETVCKTLRDTVRNDPLCWKNIHIAHPLNEKITDDILLELTNRALGKLESLTLVGCSKITDDGLKRVLEKNGRLTKLCVPGCTRLSIEGIVTSLTAFKNVGAQGVKQLRIGWIYGVTQKHFEELKLLLGIGSTQQNSDKLRFYHRGSMYLSYENDCPIDIESCPICQNPRLVYDCPAEGCLGKKHTTQVCRACTICIPRCAQCGRCINDSEYEETFCLELLCSACGKQLLDCQERHDSKNGLSGPPALDDLSCSVRDSEFMARG